MKIAMTISGQPRRHIHGFKELKKWFLDRYNIDVYLHTWVDKKFYKYDFFNQGKIQKVHKVNSKLYDELLDLYQPKNYLFEKAIQFEATEIKGSHNQRLNSQMSMWMSLQRAWDLVEQSGIKYDLVIRTRYDLLFTHQVALTCLFIEDITQLDPNQLHYFKYPDHWHLSPQMNDQFAVGGYDAMKIYHNVFSSMLYYIFYDEGYKATYPDPFVNEPLIYYHLNYNNIHMNGIDHGFGGHRGLDAGAQIMR